MRIGRPPPAFAPGFLNDTLQNLIGPALRELVPVQALTTSRANLVRVHHPIETTITRSVREAEVRASAVYSLAQTGSKAVAARYR